VVPKPFLPEKVSTIVVAPSIPTIAWNREDRVLDHLTKNLTKREQEALTYLLRTMSESLE
jgi:hypothetical protein